MAPTAAGPVMLGPIPVDFILFALVLAGIAFFQNQTFRVAVVGLVVIVAYKLAFTGFAQGPGLAGLAGFFAQAFDAKQTETKTRV